MKEKGSPWGSLFLDHELQGQVPGASKTVAGCGFSTEVVSSHLAASLLTPGTCSCSWWPCSHVAPALAVKS